MKRNSILFVAVALAATAMPIKGAPILHVDMESDGVAFLTESVSGSKLRVYGQHGIENIDGASGRALRLDGYSSFATGTVAAQGATREALSVSLWVAPEVYPIVKHDEPTTQKIVLAGTLDENAKKGWAFMLGSNGQYSFVCYTGGWRTEVEAEGKLPRYEWSRLVATVDNASRQISLYRNGTKVKSGNCMGAVDDTSRTFYIGKGGENVQMNGFNLNSFCGLIDDLDVYDSVVDAFDLGSLAENPADLSIPESRHSADLLRPKFHGMPATGWTNETHGMTYANGKFHVFFQKNANGPFMSRLHWGHISSPDLINWTEEKIALFPELNFDIKGCWSGCVVTDDVVTAGKPNIIYTGVDYEKAYIGLATPLDNDLIDWTKRTMPIINGRPAGLSDDFRDPYFFRNGNDAYIIVGTSKDGVGAVTLHKYIPVTGTWTSTPGDIFFSGVNQSLSGSFWEMPNITQMDGGKWLFTTTPQNTANGVRTLYWTGSINSNGTFQPDAASSVPRGVELISKDGFGLLSPTVYQHEGKTIALGIVPDKLPSSVNYNLGWAHCYSLPREWSLDAQGNLLQKPYEGLRQARGESFSKSDFSLSGSEALGDVSGRQVEMLGRFTVGTSAFGFRFFQGGGSEATLKYIPSANMLSIDLTRLDRTANDNGSYNGNYTCMLPERPAAGSEMKINLFIDGSVIDIFINDKWATSMRAFPNRSDADGIEVFADGPVQVNEVSAWKLEADAFNSGIGNPVWDNEMSAAPFVDVFDMHGRCIKTAVSPEEAHEGLDPGIYIIGSKKVIIK